MKNTEIGVIANPHAGPSRGRKELDKVKSFADQNAIAIAITERVEDIPEVLRVFLIKKKAKVILVYGGDGTLQRVVDFMLYKKTLEPDKDKRLKKMPLLCSPGGGTMEAVKMWLGVEGAPLEIIKQILQTPYEYLPRRSLRPLQISYTDQKGERKIRYGFFFIQGAVARVIKKYEDEGRSLNNGLKHFALGVLAGMIGLPPGHRQLIDRFDAALFADGRRLPQDKPLSVVASVADTLLWGIKPFHGIPESNQFRVASYGISANSLTLLLPLMLRGTYLPGATLFPYYSFPHQIAPYVARLTNMLNKWFFSSVIPSETMFFNRPAMNFRIEPAAENYFFLDCEYYFNRPGTRIEIALGPAVEFISSFGS